MKAVFSGEIGARFLMLPSPSDDMTTLQPLALGCGRQKHRTVADASILAAAKRHQHGREQVLGRKQHRVVARSAQRSAAQSAPVQRKA